MGSICIERATLTILKRVSLGIMSFFGCSAACPCFHAGLSLSLMTGFGEGRRGEGRAE